MSQNDEVIWPWSVRLIHWLVALIVLLDAFWLEEGDALHRYLGYLGALLVIVRIYLGIFGKNAVRFSSMHLTFRDLKFFLLNHFQGKAHFEGHNPLASIVYLFMWALILGLGISGWMMGLDSYWGSETLEEIHSQLSNALLGLSIIHLLGISLDAIIYKRKTWLGMIDGKRR